MFNIVNTFINLQPMLLRHMQLSILINSRKFVSMLCGVSKRISSNPTWKTNKTQVLQDIVLDEHDLKVVRNRGQWSRMKLLNVAVFQRMYSLLFNIYGYKIYNYPWTLTIEVTNKWNYDSEFIQTTIFALIWR